mmetsp:Transcript_775/g.1375  ORF Transcript_775/g.1375 Transcript_775/m.1375 type:complete len:266 (+) Transcript_775:1944-2741(+)
MTKGKLNKLANLRHLLAHATNIIVSDFRKLIFVLLVKRLALAEYLRVGCDNAVLSGVRLDNLEFHGAHATTDHKDVSLAHWAVCLQEVGFEINIEQVATDALDRMLERQHVNTLAVLDVGALVDRYNVSEANTQVGTHHLVHTDLRLLTGVVSEHDAHGVFALLPLDQHGVSTEELELLHGLEVEGDHGIVIIHALVHDQAVGGFFALQDRGAEILLRCLGLRHTTALGCCHFYSDWKTKMWLFRSDMSENIYGSYKNGSTQRKQ